MNNQANAAGLAAEESKEALFQHYKEIEDNFGKEEIAETLLSAYTLIVEMISEPGCSFDIKNYSGELFLLKLLYQAAKSL